MPRPTGDPGDPERASERRRGAGGTPRPASSHSELAGLGLMLGLAMALFAWAGNWVDGRLGTSPLFVLVGVFTGFGGGFWSMYSRLVLRGRESATDRDAERENGHA
ncbi:MAG: AtpZ/AtpI family protein [Gemmatimonadota bacterium]|nr:AtpZ/AtpI family protein [Gemmatimonadota bacterium]